MRTSMALRLALAGMLCLISFSANAYADPKVLSVPPGDLIAGLESLARQSGVELIYEPSQLKGLRTQGVYGTLELRDAVRMLLRGTPLNVSADSSGAMLIAPPAQNRDSPREPPGSIDGAKALQPKATTFLNPPGTPRDAAPMRLAQVGPPAASGTLAGSSAAATPGGLEEIVVTARKVEENLMTVPLAISALTAESINDRGIQSLYDVSNYTPSITMNLAGTAAGIGSGGGRWEQEIVIRGIPTASVYIDSAPAGVGLVEDIDDVNRVEVLRGPQAAYFGRSTFAGAINIVTKPPGDTFSGQVDGLVGSDKWSDLRASVEGPIIPETLAFRLSGRDENMDGPYANYGTIDARLGGQNTQSVSGELLATPSDRLRAQLYVDYAYDNDGPPAIAKYDAPFYNCNANQTRPGGPQNFICGTLPAYPLKLLGEDGVIDNLYSTTILNNSLGILRPVFQGNYPYLDHAGSVTLISHAHLKIDYEIPALDASLSSISAFNVTDYQAIQDQSLAASTNIPNPNYGIRPNVEPWFEVLTDIMGRTETKDQEFRLVSSRDKRFRWLVGASYDWKDVEGSLSALTSTGPTMIGADSPTKTKTYAGFFGLSYDIIPKLTLDVEGRYQADDVALYLHFHSLLDGPFVLAAEKTFKNFTPRANLTYKMTDEVMFYGEVAQGVNPGTFNSSLLTLFPNQLSALAQFAGASLYVQPEKITNYELGTKGQFWDNRVQLSFDGYYERWTNQIVSETAPIPIDNAAGVPTGGNVLSGVSVNIGLSEVEGVEFEGNFAPTNHLLFNAAGSFNYSKILRDLCLTCAPVTGVTNVAGASLMDYPKFTGNLGAQYKDKLVDDWDWKARADLIYRSGETESFANLTETPATVRVNLHLGVETNQEGAKSMNRYSIEAFVINAFNNLAPISPELKSNALTANLGTYEVNALMPIPRQFGVRGTVRF